MLLMVAMDVALLFNLVTYGVRGAKTRSSSDRMLTSLKTKGDPSLRSTSKDYAAADNGELARLSSAKSCGRGGGGDDHPPPTTTVTMTHNIRHQQRLGDDHALAVDLGRERTRCTLMCVVMGVVFIALTLPSAYLRARMSFAEQKGRFPLTQYEIQLMQVLEQVNQFTGVYKLLLYVALLPSFRRAVLRLFKSALTSQCCPRRQPVTTV